MPEHTLVCVQVWLLVFTQLLVAFVAELSKLFGLGEEYCFANKQQNHSIIASLGPSIIYSFDFLPMKKQQRKISLIQLTTKTFPLLIRTKRNLKRITLSQTQLPFLYVIKNTNLIL